jgi:hypothetical protein
LSVLGRHALQIGDAVKAVTSVFDGFSAYSAVPLTGTSRACDLLIPNLRMTTWRNESETDERVFCQVLRRDDGKQLGFVVRYYEDGPTYACTMVRRIGACSTDQAARGAVERALEEGR